MVQKVAYITIYSFFSKEIDGEINKEEYKEQHLRKLIKLYSLHGRNSTNLLTYARITIRKSLE